MIERDLLREALAAVPKPPWPDDWRCTTEGCGHRMDEHQEPLVQDGRCGWFTCRCMGWDPLTEDQWRVVYAAQRAGVS